jgi:hypothetical protein
MALSFVRVDLNGLALQRVASQAAGRMVISTTRRVLNRALVLCPVDTGTLRAAHTMELRTEGGKVTGRVSNWIHYALPVHQGVDHPVVIVPKHKKALRFVIDGEVVFATRVVLPPREGRPWLRTALEQVAIPAGFVVVPT